MTRAFVRIIVMASSGSIFAQMNLPKFRRRDMRNSSDTIGCETLMTETTLSPTEGQIGNPNLNAIFQEIDHLMGERRTINRRLTALKLMLYGDRLALRRGAREDRLLHAIQSLTEEGIAPTTGRIVE